MRYGNPSIIDHSRSIVDRRSDPSSVGCNRFRVAGAFFPMAPSKEGERAERLINALFGAKDGGQHHQERSSASTSLPSDADVRY